MRTGFPDVAFGLKSSPDADEDFCYLTGARYLAPGTGLFSELAFRLLRRDSLVFPGLRGEPGRARPAAIDPEGD